MEIWKTEEAQEIIKDMDGEVDEFSKLHFYQLKQFPMYKPKYLWCPIYIDFAIDNGEER